MSYYACAVTTRKPGPRYYFINTSAAETLYASIPYSQLSTYTSMKYYIVGGGGAGGQGYYTSSTNACGGGGGGSGDQTGYISVTDPATGIDYSLSNHKAEQVVTLSSLGTFTSITPTIGNGGQSASQSGGTSYVRIYNGATLTTTYSANGGDGGSSQDGGNGFFGGGAGAAIYNTGSQESPIYSGNRGNNGTGYVTSYNGFYYDYPIESGSYFTGSGGSTANETSFDYRPIGVPYNSITNTIYAGVGGGGGGGVDYLQSNQMFGGSYTFSSPAGFSLVQPTNGIDYTSQGGGGGVTIPNGDSTSVGKGGKGFIILYFYN